MVILSFKIHIEYVIKWFSNEKVQSKRIWFWLTLMSGHKCVVRSVGEITICVFDFLSGGEDTEVRERDEIRHERRKERQHDRNISRAAPDKRCMHFLHFCPESFMFR